MGAGRDLCALTRDGREIQVEIGLHPIHTQNGLLVQASIIDITERKIQEAIITRHVIELEAKNRELEQFTYIASHDLQEPLRTITNYIHLVKEDFGQLHTELPMYITTIEQSAKRMQSLVKGLLDFARLGRDKVLVTADSGRLVTNVIADLQNLITHSQAKIFISDMPHLNVYETELQQLFQNLIINAIKFRREFVPPVIQIASEQVEGEWRFSVRDNGIGIAAEYHERIFHIFQRLNKDTEYEGYGIGLANCKKIAELHGGKIWVESEPGSGSTFYFTIAKLNA